MDGSCSAASSIKDGGLPFFCPSITILIYSIFPILTYLIPGQIVHNNLLPLGTALPQRREVCR
ncbi:hypothetical protein BDW71DRAFT_191811 [Aspergillus fruticulosus]